MVNIIDCVLRLVFNTLVSRKRTEGVKAAEKEFRRCFSLGHSSPRGGILRFATAHVGSTCRAFDIVLHGGGCSLCSKSLQQERSCALFCASTNRRQASSLLRFAHKDVWRQVIVQELCGFHQSLVPVRPGILAKLFWMTAVIRTI